MIEVLLDAGAEVDVAMICLLLQHQKDARLTDANGVTALAAIEYRGHNEVVKLAQQMLKADTKR